MNEEKEPTRYAWVMEGDLVAGTLQDFAKQWEHFHYSGIGYPGDVVLTWDGLGEPVQHQVERAAGAADENDYLPYTLSVNGESVTVSIDGRA